jgi:arabinosyltransferase C
VLVFSGTSVRWLQRDLEYIKNNVSRTTLQPIYLNQDEEQILAYLNSVPGKKIVVAPPGVAARPIDASSGQPLDDVYLTPIVPDLNPVVSGMTGSYTYAGHWSETPEYLARRNDLSRLFQASPNVEDKRQTLSQIGVNYIVAPAPEAFPQIKFFDFSSFGTVVVDGKMFRLIKIGG